MPGLFIFISEGNNAGLITEIINQEGSTIPNALVILSAYRETEKENLRFAKNIAMTEIPVLDLILSKDNPRVKPSATLRKTQTEKELKVIYRQKLIHNLTPNYYPEVALTKEIRGWLKSIGW